MTAVCLDQPSISIRRSPHDQKNPYCMISREMLQDRNLSPKGKGILAYLLSLPDDWQFYHSQLMDALNIGETCLNSGLEELIKTGYAKRERIRNAEGRFTSYSYEISEFKKFVPNLVFQPGSSSPEKQALHNTYYTKELKQQQEPTAPSASPIAAVSSEKKQKEYAKPYEKKKNTPMPECLAKLPIPLADKEWICKHFDTPTIEHAVSWVVHPLVKIKQSVVQAVKWACRTLPELPCAPEDKIVKNKQIAKKIILGSNIPSTCEADVLNEYVLFYFKCSNHPGTVINYTDSNFEELLLNACKKYQFTPKQKKAA
jgi:hypothetical protein